MSENKIVVPEGMLEAAVTAFMLLWEKRNDAYRRSAMGRKVEEDCRMDYRRALESALRWLSEHPIVPTNEQVDQILIDAGHMSPEGLRELRPVNVEPKCYGARIAVEWQRRMFRAPEVRQEIADLAPAIGTPHREKWIEANEEAYRRGQAAKENLCHPS